MHYIYDQSILIQIFITMKESTIGDVLFDNDFRNLDSDDKNTTIKTFLSIKRCSTTDETWKINQWQ